MPTPTLRLTAATIAVIGVAGCGGKSSSDTTSSPSSSGAAKTTIAVPAKVRAKGTLTVASDATYPPIEFLASDGHTVQGLDADLSAALAKKLGLHVKLVNAPFDGILPGLQSGKYDLGISGFTDTREREKTVDFVTYFSAGTSFFVRAGDSAAGVTKVADLCGHTVAVQKGTVQADDAGKQAKRCKVNVRLFPDQPAANLALASKRADVVMADSPVAAYAVKRSGGRFALSGKAYGTAPYGIAIPKDAGLSTPIHQAVEGLMHDGTYASILRKWGLQVGALESSSINGAVS